MEADLQEVGSNQPSLLPLLRQWLFRGLRLRTASRTDGSWSAASMLYGACGAGERGRRNRDRGGVCGWMMRGVEVEKMSPELSRMPRVLTRGRKGMSRSWFHVVTR